MSKTKYILLLLIMSSGICHGQFSGNTYILNNEYIHFLNDSFVDFNLLSNGCLVTEMRGYGKYTVKDNNLVIKTVENDSIKK